MKIEDKCIKLINKNGFLYGTMPSGEIIPMQLDLIINQGMTKGLVHVQVNLKTIIRLDEFEILKTIDPDKFIEETKND